MASARKEPFIVVSTLAKQGFFPKNSALRDSHAAKGALPEGARLLSGSVSEANNTRPAIFGGFAHNRAECHKSRFLARESVSVISRAWLCHKLRTKQAMKIGYARVSTEDQNPDLQLTALKRAGCGKIFTDKATGTNTKRPALEKCLKALKAGDVLTVWKLDRLGRSLRDLIALLDDLKARGVAFQSLTEAIDTETPTGRAMWQMVGILAELERSLIQERTKAGRAAAVARGVRMGRKRLLIRATGRPRPQTDRAGGRPRQCGPIAQRLAANALQGLKRHKCQLAKLKKLQ